MKTAIKRGITATLLADSRPSLIVDVSSLL